MELTEAMRTTGTCRRFRPDPVPDDVLHRAFEVARFGPQGGNRQPLRWVVVRDPVLKQALADLYAPLWEAYPGRGSARRDRPPTRAAIDADHFVAHLAEVPAIIVVCAELAALYPTDVELGRLSVVGGGSIYPTVQNLCLALREQGVGTAFTTLLCREEPRVRELLGIPEGIITAGHIAVGYPERPFPTTLRRGPVERVVFADRYDRPLFDGG
ncbi:nitroreductase family protein [Pseudonocardia lacus]|uniref:nitroreductase family protein n=1 Tax=Pseudonocardia lacus TaxID=2835865 RepID=UPI001BDC6DBD|nr:nitroreductase family protein [Pseudonocardia lacus]